MVNKQFQLARKSSVFDPAIFGLAIDEVQWAVPILERDVARLFLSGKDAHVASSKG